MIALIIIGIILLIIIILLMLPVNVYLKYEDDFFFNIRILGIKVYDIKPKQDINEPEPEDTESDRQAEEPAENLFDKLKDKLGFFGAVKEIMTFVKALLERVRKTLKHILIRKVKLDITVATDNAAKTAIEYGSVCTAVYPVLTLLNTSAKIKMKQININSDFNSDTPDFKFSLVIKLQVVYLLILAFDAFSEYNKFKLRNELK